MKLLALLVMATIIASGSPIESASALDALPAYRASTAGSPGSFVWSDGRASRKIAIGELETLPMVQVRTGTGWDEQAKTFEGVLLSDFLAHVGAADAASITVRGIDNYSAVIPRADWARFPVILATRSDGRPMSTRQRGPARIVYPRDLHPELATTDYSHRMVWMIGEITR